MSKRTSSRSGLFLLELIISILFFSVASAICIQLFVKAHLMDKDNQNLTTAVKLSENFAEIYTAVDGDVAALSAFFPEANILTSSDYAAQSFRIDYNSDWHNSTSENASYRMTVCFYENPTSAGVMRTAQITIFDCSKEPEETSSLDISEDAIIHSLEVSVYISNRGGVSDEK